MKNITLLALDTSTEACSVALWHKGEKTHLDELAQRTHTKRILPMVDELLANSGINLKQVDALAFGIVQKLALRKLTANLRCSCRCWDCSGTCIWC